MHDSISVREHFDMECGSGSSGTGRWAREVLVIVALVCVSCEECMRSYGFATHVWETGARDFARVNIASRWGGRGVCLGAGMGGRVGHTWRSQGAGCMSEGYYEVIRKSMGSGGVWRGRRGLDGDVQ